MRKLDSVAHLSVLKVDSLILNCIVFYRSNMHKNDVNPFLGRQFSRTRRFGYG